MKIRPMHKCYKSSKDMLFQMFKVKPHDRLFFKTYVECAFFYTELKRMWVGIETCSKLELFVGVGILRFMISVSLIVLIKCCRR